MLRTGLEVALARDRTSAENRAALGAAHREALSLCRIADELLMLSRLNGEVMVDRKKLNLRALLSEIVGTVGPLAQSRETKLSVSAPEDVFVNGNEGHLRRIRRYTRSITTKRARTWDWPRTHRYHELSNDPEPLSPHRSCLDYIIGMRGYDFREGQSHGFGKGRSPSAENRAMVLD